MSSTLEARTAWAENKKRLLACGDVRVKSMPFSAATAAHFLGTDNSTASRLLVEMADRDFTLERSSPGPGGALLFTIRPASRPLRMPWRKHTNAQIGVTTSFQFGVTP